MGSYKGSETFVDDRALEKKLEYMNGTAELLCPSNPVAMCHFQILLGYFPFIQTSEFYTLSYFGVRNKDVTALHESMFCYRGFTV